MMINIMVIILMVAQTAMCTCGVKYNLICLKHLSTWTAVVEIYPCKYFFLYPCATRSGLPSYNSSDDKFYQLTIS